VTVCRDACQSNTLQHAHSFLCCRCWGI